MRDLVVEFGLARLVLCALTTCSVAAFAQNQPSTHVIIPNPTPRPPDLKKELDNDSTDKKRQEALSIQSQLRAREIWLESNQILLLAQQLLQEIPSGKKPTSMAGNAAKAGAIEKLAISVQEKMKVQ